MLPTFVGLKTFSMPSALQPDALGELPQWCPQNETPRTGSRATMTLVEAPQPLFGLFSARGHDRRRFGPHLGVSFTIRTKNCRRLFKGPSSVPIHNLDLECAIYDPSTTAPASQPGLFSGARLKLKADGTR